MATAFGGFVRRQKVRTVVVQNGRELPREQGQAVVLDASLRFMAQRNNARLSRKAEQITGDRASVQRAMLAVEDRIVRAFHVIARSTSSPAPKEPQQHGVVYMMEREDKWAAAVHAGGWLSGPLPFEPVTALQIDESDEPLEWLQLLDPETREIVSAGARSKKGDVYRKVNWMRVRLQMPKYGNFSSDRLKKMYSAGLRIIASEVKL